MADAQTRGSTTRLFCPPAATYYTLARAARRDVLMTSPLAHLVRAGAAVCVRVHAWGKCSFGWSNKVGA